MMGHRRWPVGRMAGAGTGQPQYFIKESWDPTEELFIDVYRHIAGTLRRSPEAFRKRNIAFLRRNLITL